VPPVGLGTPVASGGGAAASPLEIAHCALWLRADLGYSNTFGTVLDQSPAGHVFTPASGIQMPAQVSVGGKTALRMNGDIAGSVNFLSNATLSAVLQAAGAAHIFLIGKVDNDPALDQDHAGLWTWQDSANYAVVPYTDGNIYDVAGHGTGGFAAAGANPAAPMTSTFCYEVVCAPGEWTNFVNGTQLATSASNTPTFGPLTDIGRGTRNGTTASPGSIYMRGHVFEVAVYTAKVPNGDKASLYGYFASIAQSGGYGISFP